jgi:hypothetical protein
MQLGPSILACSVFVLAGCSGSPMVGPNGAETTQPAATPVAGAKLTGAVHGGQQPITGAHVYLLAANTTGYGGNGSAATSSNASLSLLTAGSGRTLDSSSPTSGDYYATTDANGNFSISGDYTCTAGQQVYLYALGGNPGITAGTNNSASGLLAALGNCPSAGNFATTTPYIVVNEVSTIATAYAFAGFATDAVHVSSSGTALAKVGITNAFANAINLETLSTGAALATTPAGNGTVPQTEINTLANILAACVNTNGAATGPTSPTPCYTLLTSTLSAGTTGTQPADTATAAINMAHNPAVNLAALYALATATPPFSPALTAVPNDFTVGLNFTAAGIDYPQYIAIDAAGSAWVTSPGGNSFAEVSNSGAPLLASGFPGSGLSAPSGIAIDQAGSAWIANFGSGSVTKISSAGSVLSGPGGFIGSTIFVPSAIAIDGVGNAWVTGENDYLTELSTTGSILSGLNGYTAGTGQAWTIAIDGGGNSRVGHVSPESVAEVSSSGSLLYSGYTASTYPTGGMYSYGLAIDSSGNVWSTNYLGSVVEISNSGSVLSGANGFTGGGMTFPGGVAIDGAGNVWTSNYESSPQAGITELSSSGAALSPAARYASGLLDAAKGIAVDGSGNVWATNGLSATSAAGNVVELVGIATPVITPISAGLPATPTVDGSSKLGTRP